MEMILFIIGWGMIYISPGAVVGLLIHAVAFDEGTKSKRFNTFVINTITYYGIAALLIFISVQMS